jgi:protein O-mannosyl-transferase
LTRAAVAVILGEMKPRNQARSAGSNNRSLIFGICVFLVAIVFLVFGRTMQFPFVNFDDDHYVYENADVVHGLTLHGMALAFNARGEENWIPLTTLSHILDCQLYGLKAGAHHLTNVLLHAASSVLLFLIFYRMTRALWRSAFVAALFAIHPLGVESVAWIAERKDVLSGVFFMLTLWAYARCVRNPKSWMHYGAALIFAALGLMSKPMLVTLPFVLLLLDYWPLNRFASPSVAGRLVIEKIPFLALSVAVCVMTWMMQQTAGATNTLAAIPLPLRIENAFVSFVRYLGKIFWPENLAVFYPLPGHWPAWLVIFSIILIVALCVGAVVLRKKYPFVFTGWFWFAGMLVPVIGLVQVGSQAMADRYVYLPQIGLYVLVVWLLAELFARSHQHQVMLTGVASVIMAALTYRAFTQVSYWSNSETLWRHALACAPDDIWAQNPLGYAIVHNNLGSALLQDGQIDEAILQFQAAQNVDPRDAAACYNLGNALLQQGHTEDAIAQYRQTLKLNPANATASYNLGNALLQEGHLDEAIVQFREEQKLGVADAGAFFNLGNALLQAGRVVDAITQYREALKIDAGNAAAHSNLGSALLRDGQVDEAVGEFQEALKIQPDSATFQNNLARVIWAFATSPDPSMRNGPKAIELAQQANKLTGGKSPVILRVLAAAEAESRNYHDAMDIGQQALSLAHQEQNSALSDALRQDMAFYQAGSPVRSSPTNMAGWQ